jgi:glycerol-1-phosphate dehydrogenase [NAD(P)+]
LHARSFTRGGQISYTLGMDSSKLPEVIDIGPGVAKRLAAFCAARPKAPLRLVADSATWAAMGAQAERELRAAGLATRATIFDEPYLAADARSVFRLLLDDDPRERIYIAIGSGTITDMVRFACHRTGRDFISLATAASVDAYASIVAPLNVDGVKLTVPAAAPIAVFADTDCLASSPRPMIAAGFGDMLCKFSAVADWRLGALLWNEPFDEAIARRSVAAARSCVEAASAIGAARPEGLAALMGALVESGLCMALAGHSRPASGADHQYSHFWEMRLLREGRPPILHGLKVGIGTLEVARLWDGVRDLPKARAAALLAAATLPARSEEEGLVREAFGEEAGAVIAAHQRFIAMRESEYEALKKGILDNWEAILGFAATVPSAAETERLLALAGCPTDPLALGLKEEEVALGLKSAHYIRDRFTIKKLSRILSA